MTVLSRESVVDNGADGYEVTMNTKHRQSNIRINEKSRFCSQRIITKSLMTTKVRSGLPFGNLASRYCLRIIIICFQLLLYFGSL